MTHIQNHTDTQVGGLGDVVTSLAKAHMSMGALVELVVPKFDVANYSCVMTLCAAYIARIHARTLSFSGTCIRAYIICTYVHIIYAYIYTHPSACCCCCSAISDLRHLTTFPVPWAGSSVTAHAWCGVVEGLPVYLIEAERPHAFFWRGRFYGEVTQWGGVRSACHLCVQIGFSDTVLINLLPPPDHHTHTISACSRMMLRALHGLQRRHSSCSCCWARHQMCCTCTTGRRLLRCAASLAAAQCLCAPTHTADLPSPAWLADWLTQHSQCLLYTCVRSNCRCCVRKDTAQAYCRRCVRKDTVQGNCGCHHRQ